IDIQMCPKLECIGRECEVCFQADTRIITCCQANSYSVERRKVGRRLKAWIEAASSNGKGRIRSPVQTQGHITSESKLGNLRIVERRIKRNITFVELDDPQ